MIQAAGRAAWGSRTGDMSSGDMIRPAPGPAPGDEAFPEYEEVLGTVARRIRDVRTASNLSQRQLADRAGLKASQIFELETGASNITLRTLTRIAVALAVPPRELLPDAQARPVSRHELERLATLCTELARELGTFVDEKLAVEKSLIPVDGTDARPPAPAAGTPPLAPPARGRARKGAARPH